MSHRIIQGDCIEGLRTLPDASVHCCITSPPYFQLRDYGHEGQIGLEETPDEFVAKLVEVFREVRRVLRDDGTLWLNIGDSYNAYNGNRGRSTSFQSATEEACPSLPAGHGLTAKGLKNKDLVGIPWRVAFALQADGWWLRQDIIWHKPNPMPESVRDRCTKAHEYVFLLTKSERYFYDADAVRTPLSEVSHQFLAVKSGAPTGSVDGFSKKNRQANGGKITRAELGNFVNPMGANRRSVWTVTTKPYKGAHFATMPPQLAELCILAGTSAEGCCAECGAPMERVVERNRVPTRPGADTKVTGDAMTDGNRDPQRHVTTSKTTGWQATCQHTAGVVPCTVLDPFGGSGTTLAVAAENGRSGIACELNPEYVKLAEDRIAKARGKAPLFVA